MLKLWGRNNSVNVQKPIWCLEELKVPYERIDAGMQYGVVNEPQFRWWHATVIKTPHMRRTNLKHTVQNPTAWPSRRGSEAPR